MAADDPITLGELNRNFERWRDESRETLAALRAAIDALGERSVSPGVYDAHRQADLLRISNLEKAAETHASNATNNTRAIVVLFAGGILNVVIFLVNHGLTK